MVIQEKAYVLGRALAQETTAKLNLGMTILVMAMANNLFRHVDKGIIEGPIA